MLNTKYIVILLLLTSSLIRAEILQTSDELSNLEIVTDTDCSRGLYQTNVPSSAQEPSKEKMPSELKVETVNYKLHACDGVSSFPVTVRSKKLQGSN